MSFKQSLHAIHPNDDNENAVDDDLITVGWSVTSRDLSKTEGIIIIIIIIIGFWEPSKVISYYPNHF